MSWSSPSSSTTRTSFPGSTSPSDGRELRHIPIDDQGELELEALDGIARAGRSRSSPTTSCRTRSARSIRSRSSQRGRTNKGRSWSWTRPRPLRTARSTSKRSAATFCAFSSHKMCGPSGIGALWAARAAPGDVALRPRRRDDPQRHASRRRPGTSCLQVRGRYAARSQRPRSRRPSTTSGDRPGTQSSDTSTSSSSTRSGVSPSSPGHVYGPPADRRAGHRLVRGRRRPSARRRAAPRPGGRRGPGGHHCTQPVMTLLSGSGDHPRELLPVHDARGDRPPRRGPPQGEEVQLS